MMAPRRSWITLLPSGREDRALLRSNPSARAVAGAERGAVLEPRLPLPCANPSCTGSKAQNLRAAGPARPHRCAIWQYLRGDAPFDPRLSPKSSSGSNPRRRKRVLVP